MKKSFHGWTLFELVLIVSLISIICLIFIPKINSFNFFTAKISNTILLNKLQEMQKRALLYQCGIDLNIDNNIGNVESQLPCNFKEKFEINHVENISLNFTKEGKIKSEINPKNYKILNHLFIDFETGLIYED